MQMRREVVGLGRVEKAEIILRKKFIVNKRGRSIKEETWSPFCLGQLFLGTRPAFVCC